MLNSYAAHSIAPGPFEQPLEQVLQLDAHSSLQPSREQFLVLFAFVQPSIPAQILRISDASRIDFSLNESSL
ncbi:MAG: hypothetical protein GTO20_32890 [Candidatus Aminicenantes bacterium]|nr:hypothetical protein [Candidatus Aminicenantes bacterium]